MSDAWDTCSDGTVAPNPSSHSSPSREWETVNSIINTPASTDDEGDRFGENPQTLYEGLEAGIRFKYGMTST